MSSANFSIKFFSKLLGLIFQGFSPPKEFMPKSSAFPLLFTILNLNVFHPDCLLTGEAKILFSQYGMRICNAPGMGARLLSSTGLGV